ncbi:MAG: sensor histidine kinase [Labilithrix sp.]|nr:sensor histidine kinase [Labilithrix sp.]
MTALPVLVLYPLWSIALATGLVALRLGRSTRTGLVVLCTLLAAWVTALVLLITGAPHAERALPFGMLLAGGFVHAGNDVARVRSPRLLAVGYGWGALVALVGLAAPGLLVAPGARAAGPLFWPVAAMSAAGTAAVLGYLVALARRATEREDRQRRLAMVLACLTGALGGGAVISLRVLGVADVPFAAPFLTLATLLAAYATFSGEEGRARDLVLQGATQAVLTAVLSAVGLTAFYVALPALTPGRGEALGWVVVVVFFAALPLEPLRLLLVERLGRLFFRRATNVPDLAASVEASEARADQAERLAELGRVVAAVAHEIRNPLGVIAAQAKLLEKRGADPAQIADLRAQVDRARRFLDDLLRYGKPRPLEPRSFEVAPQLALSASNVRRAFGPGAPEIVVEVDAALEVEADRAAFTDTIEILLHNALVAAAGGAADASPRTPLVRLLARAEERTVVVEVRDSGAGVPAELEATMFEPFVTGRGRDAAHPGTGLGLAIAQRWVERHDGTIAYSRVATGPERGGACFVTRWPPQTG